MPQPPQILTPDAPGYPAGLARAWAGGPLPPLTAIGNVALLGTSTLAVFCSAQCPGRLILALYDLAQAWRAGPWTLVGGFHSPLEQECLTLLLRGPAPIIVCPARDIGPMRVPAAWQPALAAGRLLLLSPF